jgi:hypothetical protein
MHCSDGDIVRITVRRWTRRIGEVSVLQRGTIHAVEATAETTETAENLISAAMTIPPQPTSPAVGLSVAARAPRPTRRCYCPRKSPGRLGSRSSPPTAPTSPDRDGSRRPGPGRGLVLVVVVRSGLPGRLAIRSPRGYQPLPGIGDEADTGEGWAATRRGDTVIILQLRGPGRAANPDKVAWLLAAAVRRLPAPAQPIV